MILLLLRPVLPPPLELLRTTFLDTLTPVATGTETVAVMSEVDVDDNKSEILDLGDELSDQTVDDEVHLDHNNCLKT